MKERLGAAPQAEAGGEALARRSSVHGHAAGSGGPQRPCKRTWLHSNAPSISYLRFGTPHRAVAGRPAAGTGSLAHSGGKGMSGARPQPESAFFLRRRRRGQETSGPCLWGTWTTP